MCVFNNLICQWPSFPIAYLQVSHSLMGFEPMTSTTDFIRWFFVPICPDMLKKLRKRGLFSRTPHIQPHSPQDFWPVCLSFEATEIFMSCKLLEEKLEGKCPIWLWPSRRRWRGWRRSVGCRRSFPARSWLKGFFWGGALRCNFLLFVFSL